MMIHAYDESYLEGAMLNLGDAMEYAVLDCHYDPDAFFLMFITSGYAGRFSRGDVSLIAGKSGPEIAMEVLSIEDLQSDFPEPAWREWRSDIFWCGWAFAYYQWYRGLSFEEIWKSISMRKMQRMYPRYHEVDISQTVEAMDDMMRPIKKQSVKDLRLVRGLTQGELASRADMTISQIQRLEYGERKVENLSLKTALALAKTLGVSPEELK